jgi:hypothetical protein
MRRTYVWRGGKLVEILPHDVAKQVNVPSTGGYRDKMHSYHVLDEVRQQHMIDSNRAERAYNKERGN